MEEIERMWLRKYNITFSAFKMVLNALLTKANIDEDSYTDFYQDFVGGCHKTNMTIEEWVENHFQDFSIECQGYELRSKQNTWQDVRYSKPPFNVCVWVLTDDEYQDQDENTFQAMWDIDKKWVSLPNYEVLNNVIFYMKKPLIP